jgi:ribA/ribD-fused uncharacterized protein
MRFFTHEYYFGSGDSDYRGVSERYRRHLEEMESVLPPEVVELARLPSMDDGLIVSVEQDRQCGELTLVMRCGDLQVGYYDLTLRYADARISPRDAWHLAVAAREGDDLAYHEVDRAADGVVHRLLFHPGMEIDIECSALTWERLDRLDRELPVLPDRFPRGPRVPPEEPPDGADADIAAVGALRDRAALIEAVRAGGRAEYVLFRGHGRLPRGGIGKSCLSQGWAAPFEVDGVRYATAEHFMMAEQAHLSGDEETRRRILAAPTPGVARRLGRSVRSFDDARWESARFGIVVRGSLAKFDQHPAMREFLLGTGDRTLVHANPADLECGIGLRVRDPRAANPERWHGLNLLGFALMEVRERLRHGREA